MDSPGTLYRYRFGTVGFDESRFELRVADQIVEVQRKPLEILSALLTRPGEVITKEELLEAVWLGRPTVENVLANAVAKLRVALGPDNAARIVTVPRVGYRFDGPLERIATGRSMARALELAAGGAVPGRPNFQLESLLGGSTGIEVWLARHTRTGEQRVYKFCADGLRLALLKREATLSRLLRGNLGERPDLVRLIDWNFESPPYFLECEYGGEDLLRWADAPGRLADMDRGQRLALFLQVADAVAAAHSVGVLHKDLKPANILVAERNGGWRVCLTDFGSGLLLEPDRLQALGITRLGMTVEGHALGDSASGTPLYLAPEIIAGAAPTALSDVYALGVILYQLVIGELRRPLVTGWERGIPDPLLHDDIARATDGDPARRPGSVAELAARLRSLPERLEAQRRRDAELARAQQTELALQRARLRRPWRIAAVSTLVLGVMLSGLLWQRSEQQRRIAQQQAARAEATIRFLSDDLIGALNPGGAGFERDPTIREMLTFASEHMAERLPQDAAIRGSIRAALGQSWRNLGERDRSVDEMRLAVQHYEQAFGAADETALRTRYALAHTLAFATHFEEAGRELEQADALAGPRLRADGELALAAVIARGEFHFQQLQIEPALDAWREADRLQRLLRPDDVHMAVAIRESLADCTLRLGDLETGIAQLRAMLDEPMFAAARVGEGRRAALQVLMARALRNQGDYAAALPLARAAAATTERLSGPDSYATLTQLSLLASIQDYAGDCRAALDIMRTVRSRMAATLGENRQGTLVETGNLGFKEYDCGDREAGLDYIRRAESGLREHYGQDNVTAQIFRFELARMLADEARWSEAIRMADGLDAGALTAGNSRPGWADRLRALRGRILIGSGQHEEGRELLAGALSVLAELGTEDEEELTALRGLLATP